MDVYQDKLYLRIRATDAVGHITESQLVIHIVEEDEAPPVVRGLAVIDDEGYVSMGSEGALIIKVYRTRLWQDFWLQWKVNFTEKILAPLLVIFEKKKFQIMCHMIGINHN